MYLLSVMYLQTTPLSSVLVLRSNRILGAKWCGRISVKGSQKAESILKKTHVYIFVVFWLWLGIVGTFSASPLFCELLQDLVLHLPGHVTAPLCLISLFPTYLFRWLLGTSRKKKATTKMSSCCL